MKIEAGCSSATAPYPSRCISPTVNKHRRLFSFSFPYHSASEVAVANDGSPRGTGSSRTHCKFAISGFNSVVITFVAHIYSREMFRYGASCNALYLSGYLLHYFLRDRITKCIYVLSTNIICEASLILYYNLPSFVLIYDICLSIKFIVFKFIIFTIILRRIIIYNFFRYMQLISNLILIYNA